MLRYEGYKYATDFADDAGWKDYFDFLYPSEYEYQSIQNQKVLRQLEEHGDNPEAEREVDHWIYFSAEKEMEDYAVKAETLRYKVLSKKKLDDGKRMPYQLNISRMDNTQWGNVDDYVWELIELAKEHGGEYDGWGCPIAK